MYEIRYRSRKSARERYTDTTEMQHTHTVREREREEKTSIEIERAHSRRSAFGGVTATTAMNLSMRSHATFLRTGE
jgi:hypothetical protein